MTTTTDLFANSHLFTTKRALYPEEDLAMVCVQTPRAFSADIAAEGLECALSATAEQSEPRTPFDWSDQLRTMREEEMQVSWWAKDDDQKVDDAEPAAEEDYYCRREATPRPPPSPIGDYAVVADAAPAPEEEPVPEEAPAIIGWRRKQRPSARRRCASTFRGGACGAARRRRSARGARPRRRRSRCA
jgi:hypothetical protein